MTSAGSNVTITKSNYRHLGAITDFLFTHGSPGLRVRFAAAPGRATQVRAEVRRLAARWRRHGLVAEAVPGV